MSNVTQNGCGMGIRNSVQSATGFIEGQPESVASAGGYRSNQTHPAVSSALYRDHTLSLYEQRIDDRLNISFG